MKSVYSTIHEALRSKAIIARNLLLLNTPLSGFVRSCMNLLCNGQIEHIRELTRKAPFVVEIETTNICNSACVFCSYAYSKRKKGVMSMQVFQKVVEDYVQMGGGAVNLTPIDGDPLLDPHLLERIELLKKYKEAQQIITTTNGIALNKYSDHEIRRLLEDLYLIKLSIGGLDRNTYKAMFNVDRFSQVMNGVERLIKLRDEVSVPAYINLTFRTNDPDFETRFKPQLDEYREKSIDITHTHVFTNNCGSLNVDKEKEIAVGHTSSKKRLTCAFPCMSMVVCWDGVVSACDEDAEVKDLRIGHVENESLAEIWTGEKRRGILASFGKRKLTTACSKCSAYHPDTVFAESIFKGLKPNQTLPKDFNLLNY
jgi:radical SAM protein with 4Fe4S-binding SPASM domain